MNIKKVKTLTYRLPESSGARRCCYPGAEQRVEDVVRSGLSSPLQNLGQEEELKHRKWPGCYTFAQFGQNRKRASVRWCATWSLSSVCPRSLPLA